ncbi:hypothetical protein [Streptomyces sp. NPDC018584]|uniref:hypothetical protein n=1 Tax=unclassified Streptomyces TaxID=2593676 RepID=UPI0037B6CCEB
MSSAAPIGFGNAPDRNCEPRNCPCPTARRGPSVLAVRVANSCRLRYVDGVLRTDLHGDTGAGTQDDCRLVHRAAPLPAGAPGMAEAEIPRGLTERIGACRSPHVSRSWARRTRSPVPRAGAVLSPDCTGRCRYSTAPGFAIAANAALGDSEADSADFDALFSVFLGLNLGQIAAISFGTMAMSSEYQGGAIRSSLTAVPNRSLFYAAKLANVAGLALVMGLVTTFVSFLGGSAFLGGAVALMALFAAGLTAVLRSGLAMLGTLIPFILIVSMILGETPGSLADYLPDRAGQQVLYVDPPSDLAPWAGLGVTALWTGAAVLGGWWSLRRRDA